MTKNVASNGFTQIQKVTGDKHVKIEHYVTSHIGKNVLLILVLVFHRI